MLFVNYESAKECSEVEEYYKKSITFLGKHSKDTPVSVLQILEMFGTWNAVLSVVHHAIDKKEALVVEDKIRQYVKTRDKDFWHEALKAADTIAYFNESKLLKEAVIESLK